MVVVNITTHTLDCNYNMIWLWKDLDSLQSRLGVLSNAEQPRITLADFWPFCLFLIVHKWILLKVNVWENTLLHTKIR